MICVISRLLYATIEMETESVSNILKNFLNICFYRKDLVHETEFILR